MKIAPTIERFRRTLPILIGAVFFSSMALASGVVGKAKADIRQLEKAVTLFWLDHGEYPGHLRELIADYTPRVLIDPWGRVYHYSTKRPDISTLDAPFYIWTLGKDGTEGGSELDIDIGTWTLQEEKVQPWWRIW